MIKFAAIAFGAKIIVQESLKNHHGALEQAIDALRFEWPLRHNQDHVIEKDYIFHLRSHGGYTFMCATKNVADRPAVISFLDEVSEIFVLAYGDAGIFTAERGEQSFRLFGTVLRERLLSYSGFEGQDCNHREEKAIIDIREIAARDLDKTFMRGGNLERLMEKVDALFHEGPAVNKITIPNRYSSRRWSYKVLICALVVIGTILYMISVLASK